MEMEKQAKESLAAAMSLSDISSIGEKAFMDGMLYQSKIFL